MRITNSLAEPTDSQLGSVWAPRRHLVMSGDTSAYHRCVGRCYWHLTVEAKDATKHPTMHKTAPTMMSPNINSAEVEKLVQHQQQQQHDLGAY